MAADALSIIGTAVTPASAIATNPIRTQRVNLRLPIVFPRVPSCRSSQRSGMSDCRTIGAPNLRKSRLIRGYEGVMSRTMADPDEKNGVTNVLGPPDRVVPYAYAVDGFVVVRVVKGPARFVAGPRSVLRRRRGRHLPRQHLPR